MSTSTTFFIPSSESARQQLAVMRACMDARIPYNLIGDPGIGKSSLVSAVASEMGYEVEVIIGRHMHPVDAAGLPIVNNSDPENPITVKAMPDWFRRALKIKKLILFFDEFGNTSSATQAAFLVFVQNRELNGHKLPEETIILMASNPIDSGADGHPLTRPMANRIVHHNYTPDPQDWFEGMSANWNEANVSTRLMQERARITAFLQSNPAFLDRGPKNEDEASGAHPSRRSWDNLARLLSHTNSSDYGVRDTLINGTVGQEAFVEFSVWDHEMTLPNIDELMADPSSFDWSGETPDRVYATLSLVASSATSENADRAAEVFLMAGSDGARQDLGAGLIPTLIGKIALLPDGKGSEYMTKLTETYMDILVGSGISAGAGAR